MLQFSWLAHTFSHVMNTKLLNSCKLICECVTHLDYKLFEKWLSLSFPSTQLKNKTPVISVATGEFSDKRSRIMNERFSSYDVDCVFGV